jgi:hypothetical protein
MVSGESKAIKNVTLALSGSQSKYRAYANKPAKQLKEMMPPMTNKFIVIDLNIKKKKKCALLCY